MSTDRAAVPGPGGRARPRTRRRTARSTPPTRRSAGAPAAATTPSWPPCRGSCPSSGCAARTSCSSPASAARAGSRTTSTPTGCTRSTAAPRRSRPGSPPRASDLERLGGHRRRRRAVDRRQPPDPRAAPQREHDDPAVQQPDLRAHQGPVLPHLGDRQGHQVDADGLARPAVQPGVAGARRRGDVRRPHRRLRPQAPHRGAARGRRAPGHRAGRDLPELPDLQRRRLRRAQGRQGLRGGQRGHPAASTAQPVRFGVPDEDGLGTSGVVRDPATGALSRGRRDRRQRRRPGRPRRARRRPDHGVRAVAAHRRAATSTRRRSGSSAR